MVIGGLCTFGLANISLHIVLINQNFDLLLQDKAILSVMSTLPKNMAVLCEVLLRYLAHLSWLVDDVLILYLYKDLLLGNVQMV